MAISATVAKVFNATTTMRNSSTGPPLRGESFSRDSIEIQNRRSLTGLDLESLFDSFSPSGKTHCAEMSSPPGFESDSDVHRPPNGLQVTPSKLGDMPLPLNDPIQSALIQNFLSELQNHTPATPPPTDTTPSASGLGTPEPECEVPDFGSNSPPSSIVTSLSGRTSPLERTPANSFTDPMDDPFLSNFTDISLLMQDVNPLLSGGLDVGEISQTPGSGGLVEVAPVVPQVSEVDVTVVKSGEISSSSSNVVDSQIFDLSDCVNFLTSPSSNPTFFSDAQHHISTSPPPSSPSVTPLTSASASIAPSPPTSQMSLLFDFDFTAISQQDLASVVNSLSSTPSPAPPSNDDSDTKCSRKRKAPLESTIHQDPSAPGGGGGASGGGQEEGETGPNNKASQVSRAKRKQHRQDMALRAEELEEENARLRVEVESLSTEIERLKELLLKRLIQ